MVDALLLQGVAVRDVWWQFRCDRGHSWEIEAPDSSDPPPDAVRCPHDGTDAVTAKRMAPADRAHFKLIPAARVSDQVKGSIEHDGLYFVELLSADGTQRARSERPYDMAEAVAKLQPFMKDTWVDALARMRRLKMTAG